MNGEWLGKRPMRINRAAKYTADTDEHHHQVGAEEGEFFFCLLTFFFSSKPSTSNDLRAISKMTDSSNCTLYLGGVISGTSDSDIGSVLQVCLFSSFFFPLV